jgi:20S proteasome alpha/beta subunit
MDRARSRLLSKRPAIKSMTVCLAAIAADMRAIVCIADKSLSYFNGHIQWDADSSKITKLNPSGSLVMVSDEGNGPRVLSKLFEKGDVIGGKKRSETISVCEEQYRMAVDDLVEATYLHPRLLDKTKYVNAVTGASANDLMRGIADEIKQFDMGCDLLVCGFDIDRVPFIIYVNSPGISVDMTLTGFQAIGSGGDKATARLLFNEHKRTHPIERVLYDCFDAKANAEMNSSVGYEWDAVIIVGGKAHDVPKKIKELIEARWGKANRSPFDKFNRKEHLPVPSDWKEQLEEFSHLLITASLNNPEAKEKLAALYS